MYMQILTKNHACVETFFLDAMHMHKLAILNCHVKKLDFFSFEKVRKLDDIFT